MKPRLKKFFLRINFMSLIFIVVSFISVTLAWFAYSGLSEVNTEIDVKAWFIELEKDGEVVSNDIVISLSEIYPGMDIMEETIKIKNKGDSDAQIKYSIKSARILDEDNYYIKEGTSSLYVEDILSHEYPFHMNINLSKQYALAKTGESTFQVSISWPLDSGDDEFDSEWGTLAYLFQQEEQRKKDENPEYKIRPSIEVVISVTAEQYLEEDSTSDVNYNLGDIINFNPITNRLCVDGVNCLETYVIDINNKLGDTTVTLLPNPNNTYINSTFNDYNISFSTLTNNWIVNSRALQVEDILRIVSKDIINSVLIANDISNIVIGNLNYENRITTQINKAISFNGYYKAKNERFNYLVTDNCYWTNSEYDINNGFSIKKVDEENFKLYNENKNTNCNIVPVIIVNKSDL